MSSTVSSSEGSTGSGAGAPTPSPDAPGEDAPSSPRGPDVSTWPELVDLAGRHGVSTEYWDWQGRHVPLTVESVVQVLAALGVDASSEEAVTTALREAEEAPWRRMLPPVVVLRDGWAGRVDVHVPHGRSVTVQLRTEEGRWLAVRQVEHNVPPREVGGVLVGEARFELPATLPLGYHTLLARSGDVTEDALVVVAPHRLELPTSLGPRAWGLMTQLYSVRSRRSWGLGDFADLAGLAAWGADLGAEFVLVNPLHAAEPVPPVANSPYLPTSRRFLNPAYIRVEDIPEVGYLAPEQRAYVERRSASVRSANGTDDLLDRDSAWRARLGALDLVFSARRPLARQRLFERFREREGDSLTRFATWCALAEHFGSTEGWPRWAEDPGSSQVAELVAGLDERIDFYCWLQWVADEQLAAAQRTAREAGMSIGVVTDLAVGVHPAGADVWTLGPALAHGVTVGAPPDAFNQLGQDWSQPPWRPDVLAETGYAPYRAMLRTALRHAGALRVDHVMGLFRLWCIPDGSTPEGGAYVRYDHEAMISILLLEAARAEAFVIGEDLGVVEPFVRDYLAERGVLGTSILWFEADAGVPRPPEDYRELCLATVTTHDLPPTAGYLAGEHVRLRDRLGLLTRPLAVEAGLAEEERERVLDLLRERGLLRAEPTEQEVVEALHLFLAQSPARLLGVMLSDLVGDRRTQNQPGTDQEYPNWRIPLTDGDGRPVLLEDLPGSARAQSLAARLRQAR